MGKNKKIKIIINSLVIFCIIAIIICLTIEKNKENNIQEKKI